MSSNDDNTITGLRAALFATLRGVKDGTVDLDKARQINELGKTLVETARVEVDYLRATGEPESAFIKGQAKPQLPAPGAQGAGQGDGEAQAGSAGNNGILGVRRHLLKG